MIKALQEIETSWKLEAKQENSLRYFYHISEARKILDGDKFYIIGRKGNGKSAISEYILNLSKGESDNTYNIFTEKLSFKSFPFNDLYSLDNGKYTKPNQYITIWKYIIYSCLCRLMVNNQNINSELRIILEKLYPPTDIKSLSKLIENWTTKEFGAQIMGSGGSIKLDKISKFENLSWIDKCNILEDIIDEHIDDSKYYIVFDELDEDYRTFENNDEKNQYINLLISLFKAVQDIKSYFKEKKQTICPIVFLRDDIYALMKDTDKNKWGDFKISLEWDEPKLKAMLAYRISRAFNQNGDILPFSEAWGSLFKDQTIALGGNNRKRINLFTYITLSTQLRPRDYIKYIHVCAERALIEGGGKISAQTVKQVDKGFSNYLKDEVIDEIHAQIPDIEIIFSIISQIRKWNFTINEFKSTYLEYYKKGTIQNGNVDYILQTLFNFSIIGNRPKNRQISFFRYNNPEARFNFNENIVVHRGLFKALQIL